jgi:RHS repeat-associated protein
VRTVSRKQPYLGQTSARAVVALIAILLGTPNVPSEATLAADLAYAVSGSGIEVYHTDHLGSARTLTDSGGSVIATYQTDAWGVPTQTTGSSGQPFGFTGEPVDGTGLSFLQARYYDPELGRFLSRDTLTGGLSAPQSLNRYSYVTNNPVRYADPSGHCGLDLIADLGFSFVSLGQLVFGPEKERAQNFGYLALDVGGIFLPCGAGLGTVSRTLRTANYALNGGTGGINAVRLGQAGESAVRGAYDIGPKVPISVGGRGRIPDGLTDRTLTEVKNVASLSYTRQIRDFDQYAQQMGRSFDLFVRRGARLSGPLLDARAAGRINIWEIP